MKNFDSLPGYSIRKYTVFSVVAVTLFVISSLVLNIVNIDKQAIYIATEEARTNWNKDQSFRRWATRHGGLYVKPDERTPPNPYLEHLPNRDVETTDGVKLTLMNPAYMMSQMTNEFESMYGIKGKITGQVLLNPANEADPWQLDALKQFDKGVKEVLEQTTIDGQPYIRLMRPMVMKKGCVLCHGHLGFKVGDIRGGVSISVPLTPYYEAAQKSKTSLFFTHSIFWSIGLLTIGLISWQGLRRVREKSQAENALRMSEAKTRTIVTSIGEGIISAVATPDLTIDFVNQETCNIFGYLEEELIGQSLTILIPEKYRADHLMGVKRYLREGNPKILDKRIELEGLRKGGSIFPLELKVEEVEDEGGNSFFTAAIRDITERKRAEEALKESEQHFRNIFNNSAIGISLLNKNWEYLDCNLEQCRMLGYSNEELRGKTPAFVSDPKYVDKNIKLFEELKEGKRENYGMEKRYIRKDGSAFYGKLSVSLFNKKSDTSQYIIAMLEDITERKQAEEALIDTNERYEIATEVGQIGTWDWNPATGALIWNDETYRILGQIKGKATPSYELFLDLVHPDDKNFLNNAVKEALKKKKPYDLDCRIVLGNGEERVCHTTGEVKFDEEDKPIRMLGTFQNITERKKVEEEIKRYRDNLEDEVSKRTGELNFQKYALDKHAIVSSTDADGNITYANDKFCKISGYTRDELMGQNHRIVKSDEHSPEFYRDMWDTISNGNVWQAEVKNKKKNGDYYWVKATMVPFMDESGKPHDYISIRTDITERKKAEEGLKKYASEMEQLAEERSKQLIHADRMVTLGTLSAGVAHEINNPVGFVGNNLQIFEKLWDRTIKVYLEKAKGNNEDKNLAFVLDEMPGMLKAMREGTRRIAKIVHNLGRFSRISKLTFEPTNICEIIETAVNFCRLDLTVKHQVKIQLDLQNDIPNIKVSRQEMEQVLINLITNSGHAMEEITGRKELTLKIKASHVSNNIVIEIADNGHGMDKKTLDNIFNPFFTTKDTGKGTGLGLSICRGIIEQHRGDITARSTLGEGTTFTITLPIDPQKKERRKKDEKIIDGMRDEDR
ncbi:MAG TPA: PAS domain S-box protein [Nitrospinota bacterium]|nr:PAS domain S-box protein [Nitrospinota bacterium]